MNILYTSESTVVFEHSRFLTRSTLTDLGLRFLRQLVYYTLAMWLITILCLIDLLLFYFALCYYFIEILCYIFLEIMSINLPLAAFYHNKCDTTSITKCRRMRLINIVTFRFTVFAFGILYPLCSYIAVMLQSIYCVQLLLGR